MTLNFLIAPDFAPERFAGWHMLNTTLQRRSGIGLHLLTPASAHEQADLLTAGKADLVYAGDLQGNLWRFDVSANQAANWKVSFGGNPLFTAKDSGNSPQPILTAPLWTPHPRGGIMLGFGTGRNVTEADRTDTSEQSIYAVWDNSKFTMSGGALTVEDDATKRISGGRTSLVHQTMGTTAVATYQGRQFFTYTALPVNYASTGTNPNRRGWYMNFSESGERETNNPYWFAGPYAAFPSAVPAQGGQQANESYTISSNVERPFLTIMELISGAPPKKALFDTDGGTFTGSEVPASRISNMKESVTFKTTDGSQVVIDGVNQNLGKVPHSPVGSSARWRER